jgi:hypothetical protein
MDLTVRQIKPRGEDRVFHLGETCAAGSKLWGRNEYDEIVGNVVGTHLRSQTQGESTAIPGSCE